MNSLRKIAIAWLAFGILHPGPLSAMGVQDPVDSGDQQPVEFVDRFNARFATQRPLLGSQMLDTLQAIDANGRPFDFETLKGHYTVVVFGCLT